MVDQCGRSSQDKIIILPPVHAKSRKGLAHQATRKFFRRLERSRRPAQESTSTTLSQGQGTQRDIAISDDRTLVLKSVTGTRLLDRL
ncbi:hypothetical protein VTN02DRAFT_3572 [Thermoascus thermophilus]